MFGIKKRVSLIMSNRHCQGPQHDIKHDAIHQKKEGSVSEETGFDVLHETYLR
jgi:hypothetical protein